MEKLNIKYVCISVCSALIINYVARKEELTRKEPISWSEIKKDVNSLIKYVTMKIPTEKEMAQRQLNGLNPLRKQLNERINALLGNEKKFPENASIRADRKREEGEMKIMDEKIKYYNNLINNTL